METKATRFIPRNLRARPLISLYLFSNLTESLGGLLFSSLAYLPLFFLLFLYSPPPLPDNQPCLPPPPLFFLLFLYPLPPLPDNQPCLPPLVLPSLSLPSTSTARQPALLTSPCSSFSFFTLFLDCQTTSLAYLPLFFLLFLYSPPRLPDNPPCLPPPVLPSLSLILTYSLHITLPLLSHTLFLFSAPPPSSNLLASSLLF